eukprot:RCo009661
MVTLKFPWCVNFPMHTPAPLMWSRGSVAARSASLLLMYHTLWRSSRNTHFSSVRSSRYFVFAPMYFANFAKTLVASSSVSSLISTPPQKSPHDHLGTSQRNTDPGRWAQEADNNLTQ